MKRVEEGSIFIYLFFFLVFFNIIFITGFNISENMEKSKVCELGSCHRGTK